jgi:hypothetical protein
LRNLPSIETETRKPSFWKCPQDFKRWVHRKYKPKNKKCGKGKHNPDLSEEQLADALQEWLNSGSPKVK